MWLFLLGILIATFLQAVFLPVQLVLLLVVFISFKSQAGAWTWLFLAGLIFDLIVGLPIGISSLLFLLVSLLIHLTRETSFISLVAMGLIFSGSLVISFLQTFTWHWQSALLTLGIGLAGWLLGRWWGLWPAAKRLQL